MFIINIVIYIDIVQYVVKKIKNNLRNLQAENNPKFKKRAGWPENLVSYKKKPVTHQRHDILDSSSTHSNDSSLSPLPKPDPQTFPATFILRSSGENRENLRCEEFEILSPAKSCWDRGDGEGSKKKMRTVARWSPLNDFVPMQNFFTENFTGAHFLNGGTKEGSFGTSSYIHFPTR